MAGLGTPELTVARTGSDSVSKAQWALHHQPGGRGGGGVHNRLSVKALGRHPGWKPPGEARHPGASRTTTGSRPSGRGG